MKIQLSLVLVGFLAFTAGAQGQTVRITATGDSITNGWAGNNAWRLQNVLDARGADADATSIAQGGLNTLHYTGQSLVDGVYRDFTAEVLATDPDAIIFMLGTNDTWFWRNFPDDAMSTFTDNFTSIFDRFDAAENSRGRTPAVVLATLPPVIFEQEGDVYWICDQAIRNEMNPWLRAEAQRRGYTLVDIEQGIYDLDPDWQQFYTDNYHLWGPMVDGEAQMTAYNWMGETFADAAMAAVPEPTTIAILAGPLLLMAARRRRRGGSVPDGA
jgi:lysophospholipase L1-like esterase